MKNSIAETTAGVDACSTSYWPIKTFNKFSQAD